MTKYECYREYNKALRNGAITRQPCEVCGSAKNIAGHHSDYSEPLNVNWLCSKHHGEVHRIPFEKTLSGIFSKYIEEGKPFLEAVRLAEKERWTKPVSAKDIQLLFKKIKREGTEGDSVMKTKKVLAWHFTNGMKLRDGESLVVGKTYKYKGNLEMCARGYHASEDILDALSYAPGIQLSRVECSGDMETQSDKLVCRNRKVLWTVDAKKATLAWSIRVATDAVKTAKKVCQDPDWNAWADLWISGEDRTSSAADAAADAADCAADCAAYGDACAAYGDACAADAAYGAACAAYAADCAAACAADAAYGAARSATYAAYGDACAAARKKYSGWLAKAIEKERKV